MTDPDTKDPPPRKSPRLKFANREVSLPASPIVRVTLGLGLICAGVLGFLPVLGFWMVPLGVFVLSYDLPWARRLRRRVQVWWQRRKNGKPDRRKP